MIIQGQSVSINRTLEVVTNCWVKAEQCLQNEIKSLYPSVNEEFITQMFHGLFSKELRNASESRKIEGAFLSDLEAALPQIKSQYYILRQIANGLIADVTLHRRSTEKVTGGDIGFVISRPRVSLSFSKLNIESERRGILCQAKLRRANGKWGSLTKNQQVVLTKRLRYLALLLYEYMDSERRVLRDFKWQICSHASTTTELGDWLSNSNFPSLCSAKAIIEKIGSGELGTIDDQILDEIIAPEKNSRLEIRIDWPDDDRPASSVYVHIANHVKQVQQVYVQA